MVREPVSFDARRRGCIEAAIRDTCDRRGWRLDALNVRTNHAHGVVAIGTLNPSLGLNAFKANATRVMREEGVWTSAKSPWSDKGSMRGLWNEQSVIYAVDYVLNYQGDDLPGLY